MSELILAMDEHTANDWFLIALVTEDEFVSVGLKPGKRGSVLQALQSGADPVETLKKNAPFGQGPKIVPLSSIQAVEWHADDAELSLRYLDKNKQKTRRTGCSMSSANARGRLIDAITTVVGQHEREEQPASIWHVGMLQLIISGIAFVVCGTVAAAGYLDPGPVKTDHMRARARMLGEILNAVGPTGVALIGLGIIVGMMFWWYLACRNPPVKYVLKTKQQLP